MSVQITNQGAGAGPGGGQVVVQKDIDILHFTRTNSVPSNTLSTIANYTAPQNVRIVKVVISGQESARHGLYVNTVEKGIKRATPGLDTEFEFAGYPLPLSSGQVLQVRSEHFYSGETPTFETTVYGYVV